MVAFREPVTVFLTFMLLVGGQTSPRDVDIESGYKVQGPGDWHFLRWDLCIKDTVHT